MSSCLTVGPRECVPKHVPTSEQSFQRPDPPRYKCSHEKKKQFAQQGQQYPTNTAQPANNGDEKQKIKTLQLCQPSIQFACRVVEISPQPMNALKYNILAECHFPLSTSRSLSTGIYLRCQMKMIGIPAQRKGSRYSILDTRDKNR